MNLLDNIRQISCFNTLVELTQFGDVTYDIFLTSQPKYLRKSSAHLNLLCLSISSLKIPNISFKLVILWNNVQKSENFLKYIA